MGQIAEQVNRGGGRPCDVREGAGENAGGKEECQEQGEDRGDMEVQHSIPPCKGQVTPGLHLSL